MFDTPQLTGPVRSANLQFPLSAQSCFVQWLLQLGSLTSSLSAMIPTPSSIVSLKLISAVLVSEITARDIQLTIAIIAMLSLVSEKSALKG